MFHHILVPLDFTPKNAAALRAAQEAAEAWNARVTLVHVIERIEHIPPRALRAFYDTLTATARVRMARAAQRLSRAGRPARQVILFGKRGPSLLRYVVLNKVDLVVLASHRVRPDGSRHVWATLSYQLAVLAPCPVLLVK